MSRWKELVAEVERRFAKTVRDTANDLPVGELSDGELAHQVVAVAPDKVEDRRQADRRAPTEAPTKPAEEAPVEAA